MADEYEYRPLPDEESIRVLVLYPGKGDEPLSGVLKTIQVRSAQQAHKRRKMSTGTEVIRWTPDIPYEAISYVWGSDTKDHFISLGEKTHKITANLSDAMHQCRLPDQPRVLWADSICIDQDKLDEKNHQVYMMGRIYAASQRTLICLGSDPVNTGHALDAFGVIQETNRMIQETFQSPDFSWEVNSFPKPLPYDRLVTDPRWQSLVILVRHPWFTRGWIMQEAALGREASMLWAGNKIDLMDFLRVQTWYTRRAHVLADKSCFLDWQTSLLFSQKLFHERKAEARVFFSSESRIQNPDILWALHRARKLGLSDPRDRIYAFMALPFVRNPMPALHPEYEQPHQVVYQDFAVKYLANTSDLNLLCHVTHEEVDGKSLEGPLRSSWVPQWDREVWWAGAAFGRGARMRNFGRTPAESAEFMIFRGENDTSASLQVRAVIFDSVKVLSRQFEYSMTTEDLISLWSQWSEQAGSASASKTSFAYDKLAFLSALSIGHWPGASKEEWVETLKSYSTFLENRATTPVFPGCVHMPPDIQFCHQIFMSSADNSHLFLLERGYYGLGSWAIRQDDVCAFVFGVARPLILRKVPGAGAQHYKVIGPSIVVSKHLGEVGLPMGLNQWNKWEDWNELCEFEGWTDWGMKEERIILL